MIEESSIAHELFLWADLGDTTIISVLKQHMAFRLPTRLLDCGLILPILARSPQPRTTRILAPPSIVMSRRKVQAVAPVVPSPPAMSTTAPPTSTSPGESSGTTLVQALEHMPILPKVEMNTDDDLTPPPAEAMHVVPSHVGENGLSPKKRKRASAKTTTYAETPEPEEGKEVIEEKPKRGRKKIVKKGAAVDNDDAEHEEHQEAEEVEEIEEKPKKKKATPKKKVKVEGDEGEKKPTKNATPKKSRLAKDEPEYDSEGNEIVKKKRKPKVYEKIEYDIPPVERKETTFRGEQKSLLWDYTDWS